MLDWIPAWGSAALISMATTIFTGRYISPLLEVRNRRFQTKMQAQEKITTKTDRQMDHLRRRVVGRLSQR
ncbi:hypothetical protein [Streptomyces sp. NPDC058613]|uniref:hypothetical protein n=1 Tax=Streptomyces sp. NPDC058613 TaxID=3346556 RepID=UPI00364E0B03